MQKPILLLALLPTLALATPPPSTKRIAALVVPMDKGAEAHTLRIESYVNESLKEFGHLALKTTDEMFGLAPDDEAATSLKRAETGYTESKASFDEHKNEEAERKLRATIKEFGKAAGAMSVCGHLCDATAMYGAVLQARGDLEEAKLAILDLIALSPNFELDKRRYPQDFLSLKSQVAASRNAQMRGTVMVKTKPSGARVYLDGEPMGFAPLTLSTLPVGKHLVRLERPGFRIAGAVVEVSQEDQDLNLELASTSAYRAYDSLMDRLAGESLKEKGGTTMASVSKSLGLDRAVVAVVKQLDGGGSELTLSYFDLKGGKRLAVKRATFQGDEYGQLKGEIGRMVTALVNNGDNGGREEVSHSSDPLDHRAGTEEWNAGDTGGRTEGRDKKKKGKDPLERVDGMEDW